MTNAEKIKKYACSICYCQDKDCDRIFNADVLFDDPNYLKIMCGDPPLLPCGHRIHSLTMSASVLRAGREAEDKVRELEEKLHRMERYYGRWEDIEDD